MTYHIGVDLGTTYTAAAVGRDGRAEAVTLGTRSVVVPSVVCLADDQLLVGEPAARRAVSEPQRVAREFKRRVGDPTPLLLGGSPVSAELCMARVIEWVVAQVSATEGGPPGSLAVTHPADWGAYKLDLLRHALHHVGLVADRFVPEPVAAATAYATQRRLAPGTVVAVYDLGGGTFDAALVRAGDVGFDIVGRPDGIERLGGIDFDHAVFRHVLGAIDVDPDRLDADDPRTAAGLAQLRAECVGAKEALSAESDVSIPVMLPDRHTEVRLTRRELEAMILPAVHETIVALRRAIGSAGVAVDEVAAVLLVGGSSRIPLVGQVVGAELRRPIAVDVRPNDAIAVGAALVAMAAAREPSTEATAGTAVVPSVAAALPPPPPPPPASRAAPATAPTKHRPPSRRALGVALAALVVLAAAVSAVVVTRDRGESHATSPGGSGPSDDRRASDESTTSASSDVEVGGIDPGSPGGLGGSTAEGVPAPLPGDDWSDAARAQFLDDCATGIATEVAAVGGDPEQLCGCVYDDVSTSSDFAAFNEQWSSPDFDPSSAVGQDITSALLSCASASPST
jgi:actin-like ATPase involved in cell morphogenesis